MAQSAFGLIEQARNDGVAADVAGDVFLRVVGAHLLLVDVLLEDVAQHVWIDLVVVAQRAVVKVPLVGVEEIEDLLERFVWNVDVLIVAFQVVNVEQATVQVRDAAEQIDQRRVAGRFRLTKPFVEQSS